MGDLLVQDTSYPSGVDTATLAQDNVDTIVAQHINGPNTAIVAIENELGTALKGTKASLAERLAINMHADGGILRGSTFPLSPPNVPHYFYNTAANGMYIYNIATGAYDVISTATILASYIQTNLATTITAVHTFNPTVAGAPFILGANAQNQKVIGLDADKLDGQSRVLTIDADHTHATTGAMGGQVDHTVLTNVGTNTHAQIDAGLAVNSGEVAVENYVSLDAALIAIGSSQKTLVISSAVVLTANAVIPSTLSVHVRRGGLITKASTYTFTCNGDFSAGLYQVFSGFADGDVTFATGSTKKVYPEWWGAAGNGTDDDAAEINLAVASLKFKTNAATVNPFYVDNFNLPQSLVFSPGKAYAISSPILAESDYSTNPHTYLDNFVIQGNDSRLVAKIGFTGVTRDYNTLGNFDTITSMIMLGTKEYGKTAGSQFQIANKVFGLQFIGNGDSALSGIYIEAGDSYTFDNLYFQNMGMGIQGRVFKWASIKGLRTEDVPSAIYSYNNTSTIKAGDAASNWAAGGSEGGAINIDGLIYHCDPSKLLEVNKDKGGIHLFNTGEMKLTDVAIYGGAKGIVVDGGTIAVQTGGRWSQFNNIEIAQTELEPMYLHNQDRHQFSNVHLIWGFANDHAWGSATYTNPIFRLDTVHNCQFKNFLIDRDNGTLTLVGGHDVGLVDCIANIFDGFQIIGRPGSDNTHDHFNLDNSTYNKFKNIDAINIDNALYSWRYGFNFDATSDFNEIDGAWIRLVKVQGTELKFAASGHNTVHNIRFDRPADSYLDVVDTVGVTTPSVDVGPTYYIYSSAPVTVNGFARAHEGKRITVIWSNTGFNITIAAGATFVPITTGVISTTVAIHYECIGQFWYEVS